MKKGNEIGTKTIIIFVILVVAVLGTAMYSYKLNNDIKELNEEMAELEAKYEQSKDLLVESNEVILLLIENSKSLIDFIQLNEFAIVMFGDTSDIEKIAEEVTTTVQKGLVYINNFKNFKP